MTWHVYRIFRVVALCKSLLPFAKSFVRAKHALSGALFALHSALIGIVATWMLSNTAGGKTTPASALRRTFTDDSLRQRSLAVFHGHRRPVHYPLFVRHVTPRTRVTPNCYTCPSCVLKYKRRDAEPSRVPNLVAFFILLVLSLSGAIALSIRAASRNGKGLCKNPTSEHPGKCKEASIALALTWLSVMIGAPTATLSLYTVEPNHSPLAVAGLVVSSLDSSPRIVEGESNNPYGEEPKLSKHHHQSKSSFHSSSSRSHIPGPTSSYIPRPRDPYDTPRRKRSSRQAIPQRVPSNRAPAPPLPPLPSFQVLDLEADAAATRRTERRQGPSRSRSERREPPQDLPEPPPPVRRPSVDPEERERRRLKHISPTDLFAQMG